MKQLPGLAEALYAGISSGSPVYARFDRALAASGTVRSVELVPAPSPALPAAAVEDIVEATRG